METSRSETPGSSAGWSQTAAVESISRMPGEDVERGSEDEYVDAQGFRERAVKRPPPLARRSTEGWKDVPPKLKTTGVTLKGLFGINLGGKKVALPVYKDLNASPREPAAQAQARVLWEEQARKYADPASPTRTPRFSGNQAMGDPAQQQTPTCRPIQAHDLTPFRSQKFPRHKSRDPHQTRNRGESPLRAYTRKHPPVPEAWVGSETEGQALARMRWRAHEKHYAHMAAQAQAHSRYQETTTRSRPQLLPRDHQVHEYASPEVGAEDAPELPVQRRESECRATGEMQLLGRRSEDLADEYRFLIRQWLNPWEDDGGWI